MLDYESDGWSVMTVERIQDRDVDGSGFGLTGHVGYGKIIEGERDRRLLCEERGGANGSCQEDDCNPDQLQDGTIIALIHKGAVLQ